MGAFASICRVIKSQSVLIYCLRELLRKYLNFPVILQRIAAEKTGYRILLLSCIVVAVVAACDCELTDNLSLAIVAHSRPHCCYYLPLAFGQFTYWLTPHTYNESGPNFPVKRIQQILCSCQFDNRFPTQPESIYKGMCVRAPMFISVTVSVCVCVYAHVVFLTSVKWAMAS